MMLITPPLSLYIHIPWCVRKCPYCDFNSHQAKSGIPENEYIDVLIQDFETELPKIKNRPLVSIFFGGGTPSLFSPAGIEKILNHIQSKLPFAPDIEITLEANPGTVDEARFRGFREAGVNRLSIGIQSLQDEKLKALGRIHNREYALRAIDAAIQAGFDNFNLDIMHGLPNQSKAEGLQDLIDALAFTPPHLSWYQLTLEPNTVFFSKPPILPEEETLWEIQTAGHELLHQNSLIQYEVSAFAKNNHECRHNRNYWEFGDYLGIGAGAHSKITYDGKITRHWQTRQPSDYLDPQKKRTTREITLSNKDLCFEFMLNALRLTQGVPMTLFSKHTGLSADVLLPKLKLAYKKQLLLEDPHQLCPSALGQRFLNNLMGIFLDS